MEKAPTAAPAGAGMGLSPYRPVLGSLPPDGMETNIPKNRDKGALVHSL